MSTLTKKSGADRGGTGRSTATYGVTYDDVEALIINLGVMSALLATVIFGAIHSIPQEDFLHGDKLVLSNLHIRFRWDFGEKTLHPCYGNLSAIYTEDNPPSYSQNTPEGSPQSPYDDFKMETRCLPGYTFGKISANANNGCPEVPPGEVMRDGYKCNRDNAASGMELFNRVADDELRVWISRHYFDGIDANRYLMKMDTRCSA